MDQLELLKKNWEKESDNYQHLTSSEISPMLWKKSSSIVKTLFYISIGELVFWALLNFVPLSFSKDKSNTVDALFASHDIFTVLTVLNIVLVIVFSYLLYKSYKAISVKDSIKNFMASIIRTRKIIKYYVLSNLSLMFVNFIVAIYFALHDIPELATKINTSDSSEMFVFFLKIAGLVAIVIGIFWLIYKLIYGILISRLTKNYNELKKSDQ